MWLIQRQALSITIKNKNKQTFTSLNKDISIQHPPPITPRIIKIRFPF